MKKTILLAGRVARRALVAVGLLAGLSARAQAPANDDPCGAVVLTPQGPVCTTPTASTNANATTTVPNGYSNTGNPKDVWFKFTTAATGAASFGATITVTGNAATFVQLFSGTACAGPLTPVAYSASNQANTTAPRLITDLLLPNSTYYVRVAGNASFNDVPGAFTICVSDGPGTAGCGAPTVGPFVSTGLTTGTIAFTPGINNVAPFVITVRDLTSQTTLPTFSASVSPQPLTGLTPGHSYSVTVAANCSGSGQSSGVYGFVLPVPNDEPCGAIALPVSTTSACVPTAADNTNATASTVTTNGPANCANVVGSHDVWFTFTTAASGTGSTGVTVQNAGQSGAGTLRVYRAASCAGPFTQLGCSTNNFISGGGSAGPLVVNGLAPSTTYYVRADEGGAFNRNTPGAFTICVVGAVGCAAPSNFYSGIKTDTTAPLYFTPGNNNQNYTITYTAQGGTPQTVTASASPYTLTGLLPGTAYTVSLVANCGGGQTSSPTTLTFTTAIVNDEPCGAIAIPLNASGTCQATAYGSVNGATSTVPYGYTSTGCGTISSNPYDVWFTFTTPTTGTASTAVSLALNGTGKQVRVFSAASCAGPFTEIDCAGLSPGQRTLPVLTLRTLTPGTTYFVRVAQTGANNAATATFTLCLTPAPSCAAPTGLSVSTTSATVSSLAFAAGFGANAYTVTYQTPGGAVQTVTPAPTASPVALTGLVAGQAYTATVVSSCGAGQTSAPATITFVAGGCASRAYAALPFSESFEAEWLSVCDVRDAPNASWRTTPATGTNSWRREDDGEAALWTAPDLGLYTPTGSQGSAHSARFHSMYAVNLPAGNLDLLVNLSAAGSKRLTFDYTNTTGNDSLKVLLSVDGGTTFTRLLRLGVQPTFSAQVVDFPASSATAIIRFVGQPGQSGNVNNTDIGIDNVQVLLSPACASPTLSLLTSTANTASIGLAGGNGATTYTVTYQATNGSLQTVSPAPSASPVSLTALLPSTTYTVTAVSNCAGGTTSTPPATLTFTTPAVTIGNDDCGSATPLTLGVGGCTAVTIANNGAATASAPVPACGSVTADVWYRVTVPANGVVEATTSAVPGSPVSDTVLELLAGTCGSLSSVGCNDDATGFGNYSHVRATGLTPGATVYVRIWTYNTTARGDIGLCVQTDAACPAVTQLLATATGTTASISFTGPSVASGGYTVTYTPNGGTATTVTSATSPVSLTNLLPFTTYTVTVTSNCGGGLTSIPATVSFNTSTYCTANIGGGCGGNNIVAVAIPTTTLNNAGTTCTTVAGNAYSSFPVAGNTTASLAQGRTYQYSVTTDGTSDITAWIDFNQDGVFAASEGTQVVLNGAANLPGLANFTVPAAAVLGRTGLRVRSRTAGAGNGPADACSSFASGETEDYVVTIVLPSAAHESALAAQVGLFPNPASGAFTVQLPAELSRKPVAAGLYNGLGQLVRQQSVAASSTGTEARFDVRGLAAGVYSLRLATAAGLVVKRVVLE
ncbi:fibronectin type III domain-containing protein [Hymenobacter ruricola]|uniref:Fibronectin type III domain-containing protein n=1 Tax=Hymenobacter ruricola TaxID=2791023 RepID=A0ABS0I6F3_9BACT|nr:fibronectin type III domain-containing protein [Hymenobacter ruricola]MBF9222541.1 fibronectin type III domain-containing protein [Hymenobacter ruricola]